MPRRDSQRGIGIHKFYLRKPGDGIAALLFCSTFIPALFALIEGFQYLSMDDETFARKFGSGPTTKTTSHNSKVQSLAPNKVVVKSAWASPFTWILIGGTTMLFLIGVVASDAERSGSNQTSNGTGYTSGGSSLRRDTPAAINQQVYSRMMDLAVAGDHSGIERLMADGLAFSLPKDTPVRVIDLGIFTTDIKVESGPFAGSYFIVATENINK